MRIVGTGTQLQARARRRLARGLALIGGGLLLLVLGVRGTQIGGDMGFLVSGLPSFVGLASGIVGGMQLAAARKESDLGASEAPVLAQLRAHFGDEYVFLRRVKVPQRSAEADAVLVGPHGVLVLAIRTLSGVYAVRDNDWYVVDADGGRHHWMKSPTWELTRPLRTIQKAMQEQGLGQVPVQGAVVLVGGSLAEAERPAAAVVPVERISAYVDYLRPAQPLSPDLVERVLDTFEPFTGTE